MSYFREMFKSRGGTKKYLWEVNQWGEVVITSLDDKYGREDMAMMQTQYGVLDWLNGSDLPFGVAAVYPHKVHETCQTWQDVCELINTTPRTPRTRAACRIVKHWVPSEYVKWDRMASCWVRGQAAIKYDNLQKQHAPSIDEDT